MKYILTYILFILFAFNLQAQITQNRNDAQLANQYYRDNEFEKARDLYLKLYESTNLNHYFEYYINTLVNLKEYDLAIKELKKELRHSNNTNLKISLGYVYKEKGDIKSSEETFNDIINNLQPNKGTIISIGNSFFNRREFEYAQKTYLRGRQIIDDEKFRNNLAMVYAYMRDYSSMMKEYLELVKEDEDEVPRIQSRINSLLRFDFDNSLRNTFKQELIKAIQKNPEIIAYNRMLIWMFVNEKNYQQALINAIALDRRTQTEEENILSFVKGAAQNNLFQIALEGLNYLSHRKPEPKNSIQIAQHLVLVKYQQFINTPTHERIRTNELVQLFNNLLQQQGYTRQTVNIIQKYAHLQSFYLRNPQKAQEILEQALNINGLSNSERTILQIEMADTYVYNNSLWEATLMYSRIIENNTGNTFADEVKLRKAQLSFYIGDIEWAKIQCDALKASTSKLIANDAMELSLLIAQHYELDTIAEPLQMFARADLKLFQNKDSLAIATFDSVITTFPTHTLHSMVLIRKAQINEKNHQFEKAAQLYTEIITNHTYSFDADMALYRLGILHEEKLNNTDKAQELYQKIMIDYPGSIYTTDARNRFRTLRGDFNPQETVTPYETELQIVRPD